MQLRRGLALLASQIRSRKVPRQRANSSVTGKDTPGRTLTLTVRRGTLVCLARKALKAMRCDARSSGNSSTAPAKIDLELRNPHVKVRGRQRCGTSRRARIGELVRAASVMEADVDESTCGSAVDCGLEPEP
jgi:hypothetical protein